MKTIETYTGAKFDVHLYFSNEFKGHGGWNILCEVDFNNEKKVFKAYTTSSNFIDLLNEMKADDRSYEEIRELYFSTYFDELKEIVLEWCQEIADNVVGEEE